jgi:hypothetical protein
MLVFSRRNLRKAQRGPPIAPQMPDLFLRARAAFSSGCGVEKTDPVHRWPMRAMAAP